jgi:hypothetical protein
VLKKYSLKQDPSKTTQLGRMCQNSDSMIAVPSRAVSRCPNTEPVARSALIVLLIEHFIVPELCRSGGFPALKWSRGS